MQRFFLILILLFTIAMYTACLKQKQVNESLYANWQYIYSYGGIASITRTSSSGSVEVIKLLRILHTKLI